MRGIFSFLSVVTGIYLFLIFIRIIISWFGGSVSGKPVDILTRITDPYLDWWRRNINLRIGVVDLSSIAAIAGLSLVQSVFSSIAYYNRISFAIILSVTLHAAWSVVSFILGFFLLILILRLIAYLTNRDIYSSFWQVIDSISQPVLYRMNRIIFGRRITGYLKGIIVSCLVLFAALIAGRYATRLLASLLLRLPL